MRDFFPENWVIDRLKMGKTPHPTPHTLHPTPYTLHPTPHTLHPGKTFCRRPYLNPPKPDDKRSLKDHFGNHTLNRSEARART
ncbi:hypothetical protein B5D77_16715 [Microcystis sp. MC19]|nr:hypothetical protein B5D77_16715 [Microcystis sp. MC19]